MMLSTRENIEKIEKLKKLVLEDAQRRSGSMDDGYVMKLVR